MKAFVLLSLLRIGSGPSSGILSDIDSVERSPALPQAFAPADGGEFFEEGSDGDPAGWMPETDLRYDQDGSRLSGPFPDAALPRLRPSSWEPGDDLFEAARGPEPVWPDAAQSYPSRAIHAMMEPLDLLCRWENVRAACEKGFPDLSVTTSLPDWIESWGCAMGTNSLLSVTFDMMGFEEFESGNPVILDSKHGTARLSYLSTALSFSLKF